MLEFDIMAARQRKWMLYLLALFVLGAGFLDYPKVFNGLVLGGAISFYNLWLLQRKTKRLGDAFAQGKKFRGGLGTFSRMATAILGTVVATRFEEHFHIIAVVFGIMSSYFVIGLDGIVRLFLGKADHEEQ